MSASWTDGDVVLAAAAALVVLTAPGLLLGLALRLRGLVLIAASVPVSLTLVAVSAVVGGAAGVRWDHRVPAALTLVAAALAALATWLLRRRTATRRAAGAPRPSAPGAATRWLLPLAGAAVGGALVARVLVQAIASPSHLSQAYDVVFHLNAVQAVLDSGDASSLTLAGFIHQGRPTFYPAAWHDVVSLVVQLSGVSVMVATNVVALVVVAVVWPLSMAYLAQQVFPGSAARSAVAGVLGAAFPAMPYVLLDWGVLYPVALAMSVVPAALGLGVALLRRGWDVDRPPTWVLLALLPGAVAPGLVLSHPSALFTLALLGLPLAAAAGADLLRAQWPTPRGRRRALALLGAVAVATAVGAAALVASPVLGAVAAYEWPGDATAPQAVGEAIFGAPPDGREGNLKAGVLAALGALALLRGRPGQRWVVVSWLAAVVVYVVAQTHVSHPLSGPWYNDSYRLIPVVAVPGVLLAAHGAVEATSRVVTAARVALPRLAPRPGPVGAMVLALALGVAVLATVGVGSGRGDASRALAAAYRHGNGPESPLITADEMELFARAATLVPDGAVIANDPFDGSGLSYVLAGLHPLFPHMGATWTPEGGVVKDRLSTVGQDEEVCSAVRAERVEYLFALGPRYLDWVPRAAFFTQVQPAADTPAFEVVDQVGEARLLRLTRCAG